VTDPGWHPDPTGRHEHRYWDGTAWSDDVADGGVAGHDSLSPTPDQPSVVAERSHGRDDNASAQEAPPARNVTLASAHPATAETDVTAPPSMDVRVLALFALGAAVAIFFGAYGRVHDPTRDTTFTLFFTGMINLKVWFTTVAIVFAILQVLTAARIYGKIRIPRTQPSWLGDFHRLTGTLAFLFTLPVAFHCLWSLGFESSIDDKRVFLHSVMGCLFYGVFVIKVLAVRLHRLPGWLLPFAGGLTFTVLAVLWSTSALWFFTNVEFPGF
jgi:Family of unknown function (DUF6529)/Protein of unknown function (DUF2510)